MVEKCPECGWGLGSQRYCPTCQMHGFNEGLEAAIASTTPPATQADDALERDHTDRLAKRMGLEFVARPTDDTVGFNPPFWDVIAPMLDDALGEPCSYDKAENIYRALLPLIHHERAAAHAAGRAAERAEVVAWLRGRGAYWRGGDAADAIERGQHGARVMSEWRDITTAPKRGKYLIYQPPFLSGRTVLDGRICFSGEGGGVRPTTLWCPIPPIPASKEPKP